MIRVTADVWRSVHYLAMATRIAIVGRDEVARAAVARAFDAAPPSWIVGLFDEAPADADVVVTTRDAEVAGDVSFDPARPGDLVPAIEAVITPRRQLVVAVTGTGGGVGVTSLSMHLSAALARSAPTCLIDLDPCGGAADRLALGDAKPVTWASLSEERPIALCAGPVAGGFRVLFSSPDESCDVRAVVARTVEAFPRIVLDSPAGGTVAESLAVADFAILVATPTRTAACRARRLLSSFPETRWVVVTNRLGPGGETTRRALEREIGTRISLELPCCPSLRDTEDDGRLIATRWRRWTNGIARLAVAVAGDR
ncbi:MAG: hypothetical protein M3271_10710 [Actinomycetota bacterium]|nr:hypothetical protein [Actinomycetota bacterium]